MENNKPLCEYQYNDGKLWIKGVGNLYSSLTESEKKREKKYEKLHIFKFFGKLFYANVAKYDYRNIIKTASGRSI